MQLTKDSVKYYVLNLPFPEVVKTLDRYNALFETYDNSYEEDVLDNLILATEEHLSDLYGEMYLWSHRVYRLLTNGLKLVTVKPMTSKHIQFKLYAHFDGDKKELMQLADKCSFEVANIGKVITLETKEGKLNVEKVINDYLHL